MKPSLRLIAISWIALLSFEANAQDFIFSVGAISPIESKNESSFSTDPSTGYLLSIQTLYGSDWKLITGAEYLLKKVSLERTIIDSTGMSSVVNDRLNFGMFNVPIYISKHHENGGFAIRPYLGFDVNFIMSLKENDLGLVKDDLDKIQLWTTGGVSLDFNRISLNAKYSYSLDNLFKDESEKLRFSYLSASIGYRL